MNRNIDRSARTLAEEIRNELGPALFLTELLRIAAWQWSSKQNTQRDEASSPWFDDLPGEVEVWRDYDYRNLSLSDATMLGLLVRLHESLDKILRALESEEG